MSYKTTHYLSVFVPSVLLGFIAALQLTGCADAPSGIASATAGAGGESAQGGGESVATAGSNQAGDTGETSQGGEAGEAAGGAGNGLPEGGSTASGGTIESGAGAPAVAGEGGALTSAGSGGQGGTLNLAVIPATCPFHTDAPLITGTAGTGGADGSAGAGGTATGGAAGAGPTVTLQVSPFVGSYLADAAGRTLYTYGADLPGDCQTLPVSNCVTDCLISWPIFPAGARVLAAGLNDAAFGAIQRPDGNWQTTYNGWPIYYYKTDLLPGQVAGQGKAKTWHIAQQNPPGVMIMKPGSLRYLSDGAGHTLYVSAADQAGTASTDPVSSCSGECLATFEPFHEKNFSVVTSLLAADFGSFVRHGSGGLQVAYKGRPLYRAATDVKSGDMTGTSITGFTAAVP